MGVDMVLLKSFLITLGVFSVGVLGVGLIAFIVGVYGAYGVMGILMTVVFAALWAFIYDVVKECKL